MTSRKTPSISILVTLICVAAWTIFQFRSSDKTSPSQLAEQAFKRGDFPVALRQCEEAIAANPEDIDVIRMAAESAERLGNSALAVEWLNRLPNDFVNDRIRIGWLKKADLLRRQGQVSAARAVLEEIFLAAKDKVDARTQLAELLCGVGLNYQGRQLLQANLNSNDVGVESLLVLAKNGRRLFGKQAFERWFKLNPKDPLVVAGMLSVAWEVRDSADVEWLLDHVESESVPNNQAILLHRARFALQTSSSSATEESVLKEFDSDTPESLILAAQSARQSGGRDNNRSAVSLLYQALQLDPWNVEANYSLAELLRPTDTDVSDRLLQLVATLQNVELLAQAAAVELREADTLNRDPALPSQTFDATTAVCQELIKIGRYQEAAAWARLAAKQLAGSNAKWGVQFTPDALLQSDQYQHPIESLSINTAPEDSQTQLNAEPSSLTDDQFHFEDVASQTGLDFSYNNGTTPGQEGLKMHQWTGGGVAVIDFDNDTWPDLYFTQGGILNGDNQIGDTLFRNYHGLRFRDLTTHATIVETGFGQGVAAGDFNGDGFTDLYVGNVGHNRLLINQGDGTFVAQAIGESTWTTSVAIADVTGDHIPDLYDVNYLGGENVFVQTCNHDGKQRICAPDDFPAEPDVLHQSDGVGGIRSHVVMANNHEARGMGLVVGDLANSGRNCVFVANDESANQLLVFGSDGEVEEELGFLAGVALSATGQPQGSMGIASADYDGDGRSDLFVTNYYSESNNLFAQIRPAMFVDQAMSSQLAVPGFEKLGFGCQFIDANSDGLLDLAVTNGHLDDFTFQNKPFRMTPQLFSNRGNSTFAQTTSAGLYFERPVLGRSMATVDWNKDGRQDFVVTHIGDPVSLLQNDGPQLLPSVSLTLIGVTCSRDAVGGSTQLAGRTYWRTAGDGYQSSNDSRLRMTRPDVADSTDEVVLTWPQESPTTVQLPAIDDALVVQGRSTVYRVPR